MVMMISLAGSPGPDTGGLTQIGALACRRLPRPSAPPPRPEPPPPAGSAKDDSADREAASASGTAAKFSAQPSQPAATGTQVQARQARRSIRVLEGLASASAAPEDQQVPASALDTNDFCCNEYLGVMIATIENNWDKNQGARGTTLMKFTILRRGQLVDIEIERSSGSVVLDRAAQRALGRTTLQRLPDRYTNSTLTVHIKFLYDATP